MLDAAALMYSCAQPQTQKMATERFWLQAFVLVFATSAHMTKSDWHAGVVPAGFSEYLRAFTEMPAGASAVDTSGKTPLPFLSRTIPRFPSPASMEEQSADLLASAMLHNGLECKVATTTSKVMIPPPPPPPRAPQPHHRGLQLSQESILDCHGLYTSQQCQCDIHH